MPKNYKLICATCGQEMNSIYSPLFKTQSFYHCGLNLTFKANKKTIIENLENFTFYWEADHFTNRIQGNKPNNQIWIDSVFHGEHKSENFIRAHHKWIEPGSLEQEEFKRMFRQINKLRNFK